MNTYLALLRGINVGGNSIVKMSELKRALENSGLQKVTTYIQSGNVLFVSNKTDPQALSQLIHERIQSEFGVDSAVVVFTKAEWEKIIKSAPRAWGKDPTWKHNLLIMLKPYDMQAVIVAVGELKPDIEFMVAGDGVLYQSMSRKLFGRTTTDKLASNPLYKRMTVRSYNTSVKLRSLLESFDNA